MTLEELKKLKIDVLSMAVEPPWCENVEQLQKWIEGYSECQHSIVGLIESRIKNVDLQR